MRHSSSDRSLAITVDLTQSDNVSLLVALLLDFISVWDKKTDKGRAKKSKQHQKDTNKTDLGPEQGNDEHLLQFEDCENM